MLYPNIDFQKWAKQYGLIVKQRPCLNCKQIFETNIPIATKGYRGLQAPIHKCGKKYVYAIFAPVEKEDINFWLDFKYGS